MAAVEQVMTEDILLRLKRELEQTLDVYRKVAALRSKKIEQEREQIEVYLDVLENKLEAVKLNKQQVKRIDKILAAKPKPAEEHKTHRKQQDQLEDRFLEIQKLLVDLISKRFKY
jgi:hypothetical protein